MNKQVFEQVGITEEEYKQWCKENKKPYYKSSTKTEFFKKIQEGKILKDNDKLITKKRG